MNARYILQSTNSSAVYKYDRCQLILLDSVASILYFFSFDKMKFSYLLGNVVNLAIIISWRISDQILNSNQALMKKIRCAYGLYKKKLIYSLLSSTFLSKREKIKDWIFFRGFYRIEISLIILCFFSYVLVVMILRIVQNGTNEKSIKVLIEIFSQSYLSNEKIKDLISTY